MATSNTFDSAIKSGFTQRISLLNSLIVKNTTSNDIALEHLLQREFLLDALLFLYEECKKGENSSEHNAEFVDKVHHSLLQLCDLRINRSDFEDLLFVGKGDFGDFKIVLQKHSQSMHTMKTLKKVYLRKHSEYSYMTERNIMILSQSPWLVSLQYAFQDKANLYFVMEFLSGSNLLTVLNEFGGKLNENLTRFYISEIILALQYVHSLGYVFRDVRPVNFLLDSNGHLKLANFGLAVKGGEKVAFCTASGSEEYVPPEVLSESCIIFSSETYLVRNEVTCKFENDYWSVGIVAYEIIFGITPFTGCNAAIIYQNILNHTQHLKFNCLHEPVSNNLIDFVKCLLTNSRSRLTRDEVLNHPLFSDNPWSSSLRDVTAPYVPQMPSLSSLDGTVLSCDSASTLMSDDNTKENICNIPFLGFTYVQIDTDNDEFDSERKTSSSYTEERQKLECDLNSALTVVNDLKVMLLKEQEDRRLTEDAAIAMIEGFKLKSETQCKKEIHELKCKIKDLEISLSNATENKISESKDIADQVSSLVQALNDLKTLTEEFSSLLLGTDKNETEIQRATSSQVNTLDVNTPGSINSEEFTVTELCSSVISAIQTLKVFVAMSKSKRESQQEVMKKVLMENVEKSRECVKTLELENIELMQQLKTERIRFESQQSEIIDLKRKCFEAEINAEIIKKKADIEVDNCHKEQITLKSQLLATETALANHLKTSEENTKGATVTSPNENHEHEQIKELEMLKQELQDTKLCSKQYIEQLECLKTMLKCKDTELICAKNHCKHLEEQLVSAKENSSVHLDSGNQESLNDTCSCTCKKEIGTLEMEISFLKEAGSMLEQQVEDYEKVVVSMQECINKLCHQRDELMNKIYTCSKKKICAQELLLKQEASVFLDNEVSRLRGMVKKMDEIKAKTQNDGT